jgi:hypothetical protein
MSEWNDIRDTILDIKKKREITKRRRELENHPTSIIEKMLVDELTKSINDEIMKNIMGLI